MARRKLVWTAKAKNEFKATLEFYNERNGNLDYSRRIKSETIELINKLRTHIYLGRPTDLVNIRILVKGHFTIYYEIKQFEILILVIWDSGRDPEELETFIKTK